MSDRTGAPRGLVCIECGAVAEDNARGLEAHIADDPRDDDPAVVVAYCPTCAEREFGDGLSGRAPA